MSYTAGEPPALWKVLITICIYLINGEIINFLRYFREEEIQINYVRESFFQSVPTKWTLIVILLRFVGGEPIWITYQKASPDNLSGSAAWIGGAVKIGGMNASYYMTHSETIVKEQVDAVFTWFTKPKVGIIITISSSAPNRPKI